MSELVITSCKRCPIWSNDLDRCKKGKSNPKTKKKTIEVMKLMGFDYICSFNKWKMSISYDLTKSKDTLLINGLL